MGLMKKCKFFYCFEKWLNHISNCKQLDTHILQYDEIASFEERACVGSFFMEHGDAACILQKLEETLNILNTLIN